MRKNSIIIAWVLTCFSMVSFSVSGQTESKTGLLRFPDIAGDHVIFVYAGDIWKVSTDGGIAARITAHAGLELFPKFSPDGKWIAFTGQYDGDEQVYVIPASGGVPRQLTFYPSRGPLQPYIGYDNQVYGWTPDSKAIIFRSHRDQPSLANSKLYQVMLNGGMPTALPMPVAGAGAFSPSGKEILYSPHARDFRNWKRYEGGWAQDLWIFDTETFKTRNISNHKRTDRDPMWTKAGIFYVSDRDNYLNIYAYDRDKNRSQQLTHYEGQDVRWASADAGGRIIYELGGFLHIFDSRLGTDVALQVHVPTDGVTARTHDISPGSTFEGVGMSPNGRQAVVIARGDVFVLPVGEGLTRNVTRSSNAHDREVAWSPDGRHIAYVSDITGEEELWLATPDNSLPPRQLTRGHKKRFYHPVWSPDSNFLALLDKDGDLHVVDVQSESMKKIGATKAWGMRQYNWSPDSRYLAYTEVQPTFLATIRIWDKETGETYDTTKSFFNAYSPTWAPGGQYLYFLSDREFSPQIGAIEWNYVVNRETGVFAVSLQKGGSDPFAPRDAFALEVPSVQAAQSGVTDVSNVAQTAEGIAPEKSTAIDFKGLAERIFRVPLEADNYDTLVATEDYLLYGKTGAFYYGRTSDQQYSVHAYSIASKKEHQIADSVTWFSVSGDGTKILIQTNKQGLTVHAVSGGEPQPVLTQNMRIRKVPKQEWETIFNEVWRRYRDFFYVENMHGYDWEAIRKKYQPLLTYVGHRSDLNYVLGEMIAELNISHSLVTNGDEQLPPRPKTGLLGNRFILDAASGRYRVGSIFAGDNAETRYFSPLNRVGLEVSPEDYILAINGEALTAQINPYALLRGTANQVIEMLVNGKPDNEGARRILVQTISSEAALLYLEQVNENRETVLRLSEGRVGYLHIPNMSGDGIREFIKWYYGQIRMDGIIIDVRDNTGGNVSRMIMERLTRPLYGLGYIRGEQNPNTYPWGRSTHIFTGEMAMLANEHTLSDGDAIAWTFKKTRRGPLIGKRTWGGTVGIGDTGSLLDGAMVYVPQYALTDDKGDWIVEGQGVTPDIEVENDPLSLIEGHDRQLERAVAVLLNQIKGSPGTLPPHARPPDKRP